MNLTVLVVDDEPHVLQVMRTFLERAGFDVVTASNGEDGWAEAQANRPDAVISDFEMPRMNGRELLERLASHPELAPQVMYLVTSRTDVELREWVQRNNNIYFLEKPASPRALVQSLKNAFSDVPLERAS